MSANKTDQFFKDGLENHKVSPKDGLWNEIEANLAPQSAGFFGFLRGRTVGIIVVLVLGVGAVLLAREVYQLDQKVVELETELERTSNAPTFAEQKSTEESPVIQTKAEKNSADDTEQSQEESIGNDATTATEGAISTQVVHEVSADHPIEDESHPAEYTELLADTEPEVQTKPAFEEADESTEVGVFFATEDESASGYQGSHDSGEETSASNPDSDAAAADVSETTDLALMPTLGHTSSETSSVTEEEDLGALQPTTWQLDDFLEYPLGGNRQIAGLSIGINTMINYNYRRLSPSAGGEDVVEYLNNSEVWTNSFGFGVRPSFRVGKHWMISTGFERSTWTVCGEYALPFGPNDGETYDELEGAYWELETDVQTAYGPENIILTGEYNPYSTEINVSPQSINEPVTLIRKEEYIHLSLPLELKYTLGYERFRLFAAGGGSLDSFTKKSQEFTLNNQTVEVTTNENANEERILFAGTIRLGVRYDITEHIALEVSGRSKYWLNTLYTNDQFRSNQVSNSAILALQYDW